MKSIKSLKRIGSQKPDGGGGGGRQACNNTALSIARAVIISVTVVVERLTVIGNDSCRRLMRQVKWRLGAVELTPEQSVPVGKNVLQLTDVRETATYTCLSLIHISEPTRRTPISYAVFCLKKKLKK